MYSATLGSKHGSRISADAFQMSENPDRAILTIETRCELGPYHIYDLSNVQFFGSREELRKLAAAIHDAVEQLKDPEEAAPTGEFAGQAGKAEK